MFIRRLKPDDAEEYVRVRREALELAPLSFTASPEDDTAASPDFVREALGSEEQALFGAFTPALVGIVGVYRDRHKKAGHKCHVWGMYVSPSARRQGIGRRLLEETLAFARSSAGVTHVHLSASDCAEEALALYRSMNFTTWAIEPAALRMGDTMVAEHHMVRVLDL